MLYESLLSLFILLCICMKKHTVAAVGLRCLIQKGWRKGLQPVPQVALAEQTPHCSDCPLTLQHYIIPKLRGIWEGDRQ